MCRTLVVLGDHVPSSRLRCHRPAACAHLRERYGPLDSGQSEGPIERVASVVVSILGFPLLHGLLGGHSRVP